MATKWKRLRNRRLCDCHGRGHVLAWDKKALGAAPFAFKCCSTKAYPSWETRDKSRWVNVDDDAEGVTPAWVLSMVEEGKSESPEFLEKMRVWGREYLLSIWRQAATEKASEQARLEKAEREKQNEK